MSIWEGKTRATTYIQQEIVSLQSLKTPINRNMRTVPVYPLTDLGRDGRGGRVVLTHCPRGVSEVWITVFH